MRATDIHNLIRALTRPYVGAHFTINEKIFKVWKSKILNRKIGLYNEPGKVLSVKNVDKSYIFDFEINSKERKNIIEKASICINGISLTISKITKKGFQIWVIPHTFKLTNLSKIKKGDLVNVEIDILSKYVKNFLYEKK